MTVPEYEVIDQCRYLRNSERKKTPSLLCDCDERGHDCSDENCINRAIHIECPSSCKAKKCNNQLFTKRKNSNVEVFSTGTGKGWGLRAKENIMTGQFIIEYVGELLNRESYQNRKKIYCENKKRHLYFLHNGRHFIDATFMGNSSRFINHSCDPNARCEKWTVPRTPGDETRIGFFAKRFIETGEEITFDYGFGQSQDVHLCLCGSKNCKGSIGKQSGKDDAKKCDEKRMDLNTETDRENVNHWGSYRIPKKTCSKPLEKLTFSSPTTSSSLSSTPLSDRTNHLNSSSSYGKTNMRSRSPNTFYNHGTKRFRLNDRQMSIAEAPPPPPMHPILIAEAPPPPPAPAPIQSISIAEAMPPPMHGVTYSGPPPPPPMRPMVYSGPPLPPPPPPLPMHPMSTAEGPPPPPPSTSMSISEPPPPPPPTSDPMTIDGPPLVSMVPHPASSTIQNHTQTYMDHWNTYAHSPFFFRDTMPRPQISMNRNVPHFYFRAPVPRSFALPRTKTIYY